MRRSGSEPATARSALTFRIVLASLGLVVWVAAAVVFAVLDWPVWLVTVSAVVAAIALVDLVVVARRKAGGEPG